MADKNKLRWDRLKLVDMHVPWRTLEEFSHALAENPEMWKDLAKVYEDYYLDESPHSFECIYVPAIFSLAASRLPLDTRLEIGRYLIRALIDADYRPVPGFILEALSNAAESMGPIILPDVLAAVEDEMKTPRGPAPELWDLTLLARKEVSPALRQRVVDLCLATLQDAIDEKCELGCASSAGWTLAKMRIDQAGPLLEQLSEKTDEIELEECLEELKGTSKYTPPEDEADQEYEFCTHNWVDGVREDLCQYYVDRDEGRLDEFDDDLDDNYESDDEESEQDTQPDFDSPFPNSASTIGPNDPCPCGSGKKYKRCCGKKQ